MPTAQSDIQALQVEKLELDNPFWQFSLKQWQNATLQTQLLRLQNAQGLRINLILYALWLSLAQQDIRPRLPTLVQGSQSWHEQIVSPLRETRMRLPKSAGALKKQLQAAELQAEQIEQALLYAISLSFDTEQGDAAKTIEAAHSDYDSLDWLIINLAASGLTESDLCLMIEHCLPGVDQQRIHERVKQHQRD